MAASYIDDANAPRGIRNNNPGNIKYDPAVDWQGEVSDDGTFVIFDDIGWGLRALGTDLMNKITKDHLTTIRLIVSKYAPPSENVTDAYIASVSQDTGIEPDDQLSVDQPTLHNLMRAIINHENSQQASMQYISDDDIDAGIALINPTLISMFQAAIVAAKSNPLKSGLIAIALIIVVEKLFSK
jgi:hypothetical protein